jgi:hypothetical protein
MIYQDTYILPQVVAQRLVDNRKKPAIFRRACLLTENHFLDIL